MKQLIKSGIIFNQPCKTRFEWVDETLENGTTTYWLYLQTEGLDPDDHQFDSSEERESNTLMLCELHHRDTCWPDWFGPLPEAVGSSFDDFTAVSGFMNFQFPVVADA